MCFTNVLSVSTFLYLGVHIQCLLQVLVPSFQKQCVQCTSLFYKYIISFDFPFAGCTHTMRFASVLSVSTFLYLVVHCVINVDFPWPGCTHTQCIYKMCYQCRLSCTCVYTHNAFAGVLSMSTFHDQGVHTQCVCKCVISVDFPETMTFTTAVLSAYQCQLFSLSSHLSRKKIRTLRFPSWCNIFVVCLSTRNLWYFNVAAILTHHFVRNFSQFVILW